ncbi:MAG: NAD(P)/FAD-dependent oxidoreductase [Candidatus Altiarchaeota archaeon]|nr:NAD(P)/FAD-dependent oxidoreductase [Candidatus Altiarchaeota archaeon]
MKISVIGGGPAGSLAALSCVREHSVEIYEEHLTQPVQCAGLVSKSGLQRLNISPSKDFILNGVSSARIFSPSGESFLVDGREIKAYVLDRRKFDRFLLDSAVDAGAVLVNEGVRDLNSIEADRVVLATGTNYQIQHRLGLDKPTRFLVGVQYELEVESDPDVVELHFNVPGFFSWVIPVRDYARVGCCSMLNPTPHLDRFLKGLSAAGRVRDPRILARNYGVIPLHEPNLRTDYGRIITVGDAAGQVKASSGGGIVMGGIAAGFSSLPDYERSWRSAIGWELRLHLWIHNLLSRLSDNSKDRLFSLISEHKQLLENGGDMDSASKTVHSLFCSPTFTARFLLQLPSHLLDML